jgi:hypothetical protein
MSLSGGELALSLAAAAGLYYMYYEGKKLLGGKTPSDDPGYPDSGINPNWKPGAKIKPPNSINYHTEKVPTCQVWVESSQLFEDTGDAEADGSQDACFVKYQNYLARYVDEQKQPHFNVENPLVDNNPKDHGLCILQQGGQWTSYAGPAPLNINERLCFAASEQLENQGIIFWDTQGDNSFSINPNVAYGDGRYNWNYIPSGLDSQANFTYAAIPAGGWANNKAWAAPPMGGHCEEKVMYDLYEFWAHTTDMTQFDSSMSSCLNNSNPNYRWNDGENLVYYDSLSKNLVQTPLSN